MNVQEAAFKDPSRHDTEVPLFFKARVPEMTLFVSFTDVADASIVRVTSAVPLNIPKSITPRQVPAKRAGPCSDRVAGDFGSDLVVGPDSTAFACDRIFFGLVCSLAAGVGAGISIIGAGRRCAVIMSSATVNDKNAFLFKPISSV